MLTRGDKMRSEMKADYKNWMPKERSIENGISGN